MKATHAIVFVLAQHKGVIVKHFTNKRQRDREFKIHTREPGYKLHEYFRSVTAVTIDR